MPIFNLQLKWQCLVHKRTGWLEKQVTARERGEGELAHSGSAPRSFKKTGTPAGTHLSQISCLSLNTKCHSPCLLNQCAHEFNFSFQNRVWKVPPFMLQGATPSWSTSVIDPDEEDRREGGGKHPLTARYLRAAQQDSFYPSSQLLFIMWCGKWSDII